VAIPFSNDEKAVNYFIHFAKYQNRIRWDDRSLQKVIKDALPSRISDELHFSREDLSTFEGLKRAVMRIDSDYWRRVQDGKNKSRQLRSLQDHNSKLPRTEPNKSLTPERTNVVKRPARERAKYSLPEISLPRPPLTPSPSATILGPDGRLTPLECQRHLDMGLCMRCGSTGYLARSCPKQNNRNIPTMEAQGAIVDASIPLLETPKNCEAVHSFPRGATA